MTETTYHHVSVLKSLTVLMTAVEEENRASQPKLTGQQKKEEVLRRYTEYLKTADLEGETYTDEMLLALAPSLIELLIKVEDGKLHIRTPQGIFQKCMACFRSRF
jgi:hypothetical protein